MDDQEAREAIIREAREAIRGHVHDFVERISELRWKRLQAERREGFDRLWEAVQSAEPWEDPEPEAKPEEPEATEDDYASVTISVTISVSGLGRLAALVATLLDEREEGSTI